MDFLTDPAFNDFGQSDFIGGIDNEALDFGHLEQFIHSTESVSDGNSTNNLQQQFLTATAAIIKSVTTTTTTTTITSAPTVSVTCTSLTKSHLPESPPDSGSEPSYSPADLQCLKLINNNNKINNNNNLAISNDNRTDVHNLTIVNTNKHCNTIQEQCQINDIVLSPNIHSHENNHHTILENHNIDRQNNSHALYIRGDLGSQVFENNQQTSRNVVIHKDVDIILADPQATEQSLLLQQTSQVQDTTILDLESNYNNEQLTSANQTVISLRTTPLPELTRLVTDNYSSHEPTVVVQTRKRKISQLDNLTTLVKPEPGPNFSPICQQPLESPSISNISTVSSNLTILETNNFDNNIQQNSDTSDPIQLQCIRFTSFQQHNWHILCDQNLQELQIPHYRVDADKGFNFSNSDDAFVCQKKNHFQITCHAQLQGDAVFVRTLTGIEKIKSFHLHFYGVKYESPNHIIRVEQSQSDRSKKPFHPVLIDLQNRLVSKVTVGRLHFSETTSNNMRKKGRPNPEQRYFQLVVGLHAHTHSGNFPIISQGSERIIVRASNPGQFESDIELCWQRGITQESIYHAGRVGINTDRPDESLVVHGNIKVSGHIVQPSDSRVKQEISELDTSEQLKNLQKIRIVKYRYEPDFAIHCGLKGINDVNEIIDTGVIAQEIHKVLPDAVQEAGSIILPGGQIIENFLLVNKDRILMENIGAVKELCKVTGSLETRIEQLEKINSRLVRIQRYERNLNNSKKCKKIENDYNEDTEEICSNKAIQVVIVVLIVIMAVCLAAISTLYFVEHSKQHDRYIAMYDRYDVSQFISKDSILMNNNNNYNEFFSQNRAYPQQNRKKNTYINQLELRPQYQFTNQNNNAIILSGNDDVQKTLSYHQLLSHKDIINDNSNNNNNNNNNNIQLRNIELNGIKWSATVTNDEDNVSAESSSERSSDNVVILPQDVDNSIDGEMHKHNSIIGFNKTLKQRNNSIIMSIPAKEISQFTNKSSTDTEDRDLQYLSNSNGGRDEHNNFETTSNRGKSQPKMIIIGPIGVPSQCQDVKTKFSTECPCFCCLNEVNNPPKQMEQDLNSRNMIENESTTKSYTVNNITSTSLSQTTKILLKNIITNEQSIGELRNNDSDINGKKINKLTENKRKRQIVTINDHKQSGNLNCFPMILFIKSETLNISLNLESYCSSHNYKTNITFSVLLSKFMKDTKIELQFLSNHLQWIFCNENQYLQKGYLLKIPSEAINIVDANGKSFQRNRSKSIYHINLPAHGVFKYIIRLKAFLDQKKNSCQDDADDTNISPQYNIELSRECD